MIPRRSLLLGGLTLAGTGAALLGARATAVLLTYRRRDEYWVQRATVPGELRYVALGDSLAQAIGASRPELGYVGLLADEVVRRTGRSLQVINLGVTGATVEDVQRRQLPRLAALAPDLVTLAVGSNDVGRTGPEEFRRRFAAVCDALPDGSLVADVPGFDTAGPLAAICRHVLSTRPRLIPVALEAATLDVGPGDYAGDFFHPGDSGYAEYAPAFSAALDRRLPALRR